MEQQFNYHVTLHKDNTYSLAVSIDQGYMLPEDFVAVAELAKKHNVGKMMLTTEKKVSFMDVTAEEVNPLWADLQETFGDRICNPKGKITVCPGSMYCKFAMAGLDNHAMGRKIEAVSKKHNAGKVKVGVSCCPRNCAMSQIKDIGVSANVKGWVVTVGGNAGMIAKVGEKLADGLNDEELLALLDKVYQYIEENKKDNERTNKTIARLGIEHLKAAVL